MLNSSLGSPPRAHAYTTPTAPQPHRALLAFECEHAILLCSESTPPVAKCAPRDYTSPPCADVDASPADSAPLLASDRLPRLEAATRSKSPRPTEQQVIPLTALRKAAGEAVHPADAPCRVAPSSLASSMSETWRERGEAYSHSRRCCHAAPRPNKRPQQWGRVGGKGGRRHLAVHPGEARSREVAVEASFNELLRRGLEKLGEQAAAEVRVVLVRHDDRQLVLARLLDLLGQPLVRPGVQVQVEKHVGRGLRRLGRGSDGEAGRANVGELVGQRLCSGVGWGGPEHHRLSGESEGLAQQLARQIDRQRRLPRVGGRAEQQGLRRREVRGVV